jgi:uncharacterized protein YggT (Ycf19 family)
VGLLPDFGAGGPIGGILGPVIQLLALAILIRMGMIDITPMIAMIVLFIIADILQSSGV